MRLPSRPLLCVVLVAAASACGSTPQDAGDGGAGQADAGPADQADAGPADQADAGPVNQPDAGAHSPGPEPASPWMAPGDEDNSAFAWGVQTGDADSESVLVSVRTLESSVTIAVARGTASGWDPIAELTDLVPVDGVVQTLIDDLAADTTYSLAIYSADRSRRSRTARFRTAVPPGESRRLRIGATTGLGGHWPWPSLSRASTEKLDFFVLAGDTIYADWGDDVGFVAKWKEALSTTGLNDLTASTSVIATWDDHEVADNWSYTTAGMEATALEALAAYRQGLPQGQGPGGTGVWRRLSWGTVADIFVLDCRGERRDGNYISPDQMGWLKSGLTDSEATFKLIINSVPIIDFTDLIGAIYAGDRWQGFPTQRGEIVEHIHDNAIDGVLWISGDFHIGGIGRVDAAGGAGDDQWEVLTGPTGSPINEGSAFFNTGERYPVFVKVHSYSYLELDPVAGTALVRFIDDSGDVADELVLDIADPG